MKEAVSDRALLARAQQGSDEARLSLVRRYQGRVYTVCARWLGPGSEAEALSRAAFEALAASAPEERPVVALFRPVVKALSRAPFVGGGVGDAVEGMLLQLEPESRLLALVKEAGGLSSSELGEVFGLPVATVRNRLQRARDQILAYPLPAL